MKLNSTLCAALALAALVNSQPASAISIIFDYTYDNGFFTGANSSRQTLLNQAASEFTSRIQDHLTAITSDVPGGSNHFDVNFSNPSSGASVAINNYSVADNAMIVYVGAQNLGAGTLGQGGPGGFGAGGFQPFINSLNRGQTGAPATDFGPWGGAISFNSSQANWYFGSNDPVQGSGLFDFYSVAVHELGHVLGFGTSGSFANLAGGGVSFSGSASDALYGGLVPLANTGHWQQGLASTVNGVSQEVAMDPSLSAGQRKHFTELDFAGLNDTGWQISAPAAVPVPAAVWLFASGLAGLFGFARRRMA